MYRNVYEETNPSQTMRRLRDISLFDCDVRVLRNGFCESNASLRPCRSVDHIVPFILLYLLIFPQGDRSPHRI